MNSDRIKEIQSKTICPSSQSIMQALNQVWNECEQGQDCRGCINNSIKNCQDCRRGKLDNYQAKPKEHPMQKYIELGLDMEFSIHSSFDSIIINTLENIAGDDGLFVMSNGGRTRYCRLRFKHGHLWNGKSIINPIPDNCQYRVYYYNSNTMSVWGKSCYTDSVNWKDVLVFEICCLEDNDE